MDSMNSHTELSVVTAETKARQLGATVTFHKHLAHANNFPTRQAAKLFHDWLDERGYYIETTVNPETTIAYHAPIATTNVVLLRNHG